MVDIVTYLNENSSLSAERQIHEIMCVFIKDLSGEPEMVLLIVIGFVFVAIISILILTLLTQKPIDLKISNVDMANISDGVYVGSADNGLVKASVCVTVSKGLIQKISILEHEHLLGKTAEKIIESIVLHTVNALLKTVVYL